MMPIKKGNKKRVGQRGPDKKKRKYGGGMPEKPDSEKAKPVTITLYDHEKQSAKDMFGNVSNAVRWAIKKGDKKRE